MSNGSKEVTTGSEKAPVQRAKQTRGWGFERPNLELISCLSSPDFFLKAVERMVSSHCNLYKANKRTMFTKNGMSFHASLVVFSRCL